MKEIQGFWVYRKDVKAVLQTTLGIGRQHCGVSFSDGIVKLLRNLMCVCVLFFPFFWVSGFGIMSYCHGASCRLQKTLLNYFEYFIMHSNQTFLCADPDRIEEKRKRKGDWLNRVITSSGFWNYYNAYFISCLMCQYLFCKAVSFSKGRHC